MKIIKARIAIILFIVGIWSTLLPFFSVPVYAQATTISDVEEATLDDFTPQGCTDNGNSCDCRLILRPKGETDPAQYFPVVGTRSDNNDHILEKFTFKINREKDWEVAWYVGRPSDASGNITDNCQVKLEQHRSEIDESAWNALLKGAAAGCVVGAIGVFGGGCIGGIVLGGGIGWASTKIDNLFGLDNWDTKYQTEPFDCLWTGDNSGDPRCGTDGADKGCKDNGGKRGWRIGGFYDVHIGDYDQKHVAKLSFQGHQGDGGNKHLCSIGIAPLPASEMLGDFGNDPLPFQVCNQVPGKSNEIDTPRGKCAACQTNNKGIWTSLGCIPSDSGSIVASFVRVGLMLGGGVALLLILISAFKFSTSAGDPTKTGDAKNMLTSAIVGLLFVIFSVTILQFIGVTILKIPGFG